MLYMSRKEQDILNKIKDFNSVIVEPEWDKSRPYIYPGNEPVSNLILGKLINKGWVTIIDKEFQPIDIEDCKLYRATKDGVDLLSKLSEYNSI